MPAERVAMRRVREILRHRFEEGLGHKSVAVRVGTAPSTVPETLRRLERAGLSWPLAENVSDAVLEAALYKAAGTKTGHRRIEARFGDWTIERISREASAIGSDVALLCDRILADRLHPEQGYRACLGIIRLVKAFEREG